MENVTKEITSKWKCKKTTPLIPPINLAMNAILTAIQLLDSPEEHIILLCLYSLDNYTQKNELECLNFMLKNNFSAKCLNILGTLDMHPQIYRMALKVLHKIFKYTNLRKQIDDAMNSIMEILINLFMYSFDTIIMEYCTNIINQICRESDAGDKYCHPAIIEKIFSTIIKGSDVDLTVNCLKMILTVSSIKYLESTLSKMKEFRINILNEYLLDSTFCSIIMDIFFELSNWQSDSVHAMIFEGSTVKYLFSILLGPKWTSFEDKAYNVILNCAQHYKCQCKCVTCKEFTMFILYAKTMSVNHALACVTLVAEFSKSPTARQAFFDMGIHKRYADYFKICNDTINTKLCEGVATLCCKCYITENSVHNLFLKEFAKILEKSDLAWIPHRQAPIYPLHTFLVANPKLSMVYFKYKIIKYIKLALLHRSKIEKTYVFYVMEIYQIFLLNEFLHDHILSTKIFDIFYYKFEKCVLMNIPENNVYLNILYLALNTEAYRKIFLEKHGHHLICEGLKRNGHNLNISLLEFIKRIVHNKDISFALLRAKIVPILKSMSEGRLNQRKVICKRIIDDFYKHDIIFKFFDKRELEITDIISRRFVTFIGKPPEEFPFITTYTPVDFTQDIATMLVVDLIGDEPSINLSDINIDDTIITSTSSVAEIHNASYSLFHMDPSIAVYDSRLYLYINEIKQIFSNEMKEATIQQKIQRIAVFIASYVFNDNAQYFNYNDHLKAIKIHIKSFYIPIGYIRIGTLTECSVLFKVIADQFNIPCTLRRHKYKDHILWNEVPIWNCKFFKLNRQFECRLLNENENNSDHDSNLTEQIINTENYSNSINSTQNSPTDIQNNPIEADTGNNQKDSKEENEEMSGDQDQNIKSESESNHEPDRFPCMSYYIVDLKENIGALYPVDSLDALFYREQISEENRPKLMKEMEKIETKINENLYSRFMKI